MGRKKRNKIRIQIKMTPDVRDKLDAQAKRERIDRSQLIENLAVRGLRDATRKSAVE